MTRLPKSSHHCAAHPKQLVVSCRESLGGSPEVLTLRDFWSWTFGCSPETSAWSFVSCFPLMRRALLIHTRHVLYVYLILQQFSSSRYGGFYSAVAAHSCHLYVNRCTTETGFRSWSVISYSSHYMSCALIGCCSSGVADAFQILSMLDMWVAFQDTSCLVLAPQKVHKYHSNANLRASSRCHCEASLRELIKAAGD